MFALKGQRTAVKSKVGVLPSKTQQNQKDMCDIEKIYKHYTKYKVVPDYVNVKSPQYRDLSNIPTFQEAQNMMVEANKVFERVPLEIRRLCDHNPAKVMDFIEDPKNREMLEKYGMIKKEEAKKPDQIDLLEKIVKNTEKGGSSDQAQSTT